MGITRLFTLIAIFVSLSCSLGSIEFTWKIDGEIEPNLLETIKTDSPLASKELSIPSLAVLGQLADTQTDLWLEELHSRAYFDAEITWNMDSATDPVALLFTVNAGPIYPLASVDVQWVHAAPFDVEAADLGLQLGDPAFPASIFDAEERMLHLLAVEGYPLARITGREVLADQQTHRVYLVLYVDSGEPMVFGTTTISGNTTVNEELIRRKIAWKEGRPFDPARIERTQEALEATGLFSAVSIKESAACGEVIPFDIQLTEAKHRTVAAGVAYSTQQGPGLSGEWHHRNCRGRGERIDIQAKLWGAVQTGQVEYTIPGFRHSNQDLRFIAEGDHETTKGYTETSGSLSAMVDKRINDTSFLSYGTSYKVLRTSHSDNNGIFHLLKFPILLKWSTANDLLDPTQGVTFTAKSVPSFQVGKDSFGYWTNTGTATFYLPLSDDGSWTLAEKVTAGTILGASRKELPPSERLYSGTENTLRGYRFMSVSPLDHRNKPIGGRSMLVSSTELRWKCTEKVGLAAFYEVGNVYANPFPDFNKGVLQSAGAGIRYHTPVGPIRFDVAVPLNRRKGIDPPCQFYMSIGQSF